MHYKNKQLVERLITKSNSNSLNWEKTEGSDQFRLNLPNGIIVLSKESVSVPTEFGICTRYSLTILDKDANAVDKIGYTHTNTMSPSTRMDYNLLSQLYEIASRDVRGVDRTIDSLLSDLK